MQNITRGVPQELLRQAIKKRGWILTLFAAVQFVLLFCLSLFQMRIYGVSLYIAIPVCGIGALLTSLGGSTFMLFAVGALSALRPVHEDNLNPLNYKRELDSDTRIAVLMCIYEEDPCRVAGGLAAMIEEVEQFKESSHFDWFILSDTRDENIITQEQYVTFMLREKFPKAHIAYRQRIVNTFAKVGNTADFYRRWGLHYKYVVMLDADSMMPGKSMVDLAQAIEGNDNTALIQSRFMEVTSSTIFGMVSNFRFLIDNYLYTYYYNFFNPGRGFYMGHNAIVRVKAFMRYCNLPITKGSRLFPARKMLSHDYYEGSLLQGAGYDTWILPQIPSFDQQLHDIVNFYTRERRWLIGAQSWFKFFMSKSLSTFGKITMFQRALFYYAATVALVTFLLTYYGIHYIFTHPLHARWLGDHFRYYQEKGDMKLIFSLGLILLVPSTWQMIIYLFIFHKKKVLSKMGGPVKFIFSYFLFSFWQSKIILLATYLINIFLFSWLKGQSIDWGAQDRESSQLSWGSCLKSFLGISIFGFFLLLYIWLEIFPYLGPIQFRILGIRLGTGGIFAFKVALLIPPAILLFSPVFAYFTSKEMPWIKKLQWLSTFYDDGNLFPVVRNTYRYTDNFKRQVPLNYSFDQAVRDPWFALRYMNSIPSRPAKYRFWIPRLSNKNIEECSRLEKLVIFRCRELWNFFVLKEIKRSTAND